jgi:hypothetical protein
MRYDEVGGTIRISFRENQNGSSKGPMAVGQYTVCHSANHNFQLLEKVPYIPVLYLSKDHPFIALERQLG